MRKKVETRGRPRKIEAEPMDDAVKVRTTTTIKEAWAQKSKRAGFTNISDWFRALADAP